MCPLIQRYSDSKILYSLQDSFMHNMLCSVQHRMKNNLEAVKSLRFSCLHLIKSRQLFGLILWKCTVYIKFTILHNLANSLKSLWQSVDCVVVIFGAFRNKFCHMLHACCFVYSDWNNVRLFWHVANVTARLCYAHIKAWINELIKSLFDVVNKSMQFCQSFVSLNVSKD